MLYTLLHLQLALNYTATPVTVASNKTTSSTNMSASEGTYAQRQLSRVVGEKLSDLAMCF